MRLPYSPGLDGLRALAVIAVLLYHAEVAWIPGGFLGVEVFFVISGYLITALVVAEWRQVGRLDLKGFWLRRARRLLPALYVVLVVTLGYAVVFLPGEVAGLRADAIAAFGYVTNWYLVVGDESYFEAVGRPSLLKHLWSLAVEEQFYLLWPPIVALGLSVGARRFRERRVVLIALGGAGLSALLMAALYRPEVDPSRLYFGTDTRASGLLMGAALAFVWMPGTRLPTPSEKDRSAAAWRHRLRHRLRLRGHRVRRRSLLERRWGWTAPLLLDGAGLAALGALLLLCMRLGEFEPFVYRGGLASVGLATAIVVMACAHPHTYLGTKILGWPALRWVGLRSYGIYLWHWPVFMLSRPHLEVDIEGLGLLGLRLGLTVVLADLSYRYVERPIRRGGIGRAWRALGEARGFERWELGVRWAGVVVPILAMSVVLGVAVAHARPPEPPSYLSTKKVHIEASDQMPGLGKTAEKDSADLGAPATAPESAAVQEKRDPGTDATDRDTLPRAHETAAGRKGETVATEVSATAPTSTVTAIGDSAMLGAVEALGQEIPSLAIIDARGSRQAPEAIGVLRQLRAAGKLGDVVIVHIGNNGVFTAEEFDEMMNVLGGVDEVLIVNVTVPDGYSWAPNNEVLADGVRRYPNAVLVDWHGASAGHPEYFWDGIHLTPQGAQAYVDLIAAAYEEHGR